MFRKATHYFLVSGASDGFTELNAFDQALLEAGVGDTNLVRMSSIIPPACTRVEPFKLPFGDLVPVAYAAETSSNHGAWISAAVATATPMDAQLPGLIMEISGEGRRPEMEARVREMANQGMGYRNRAISEVLVQSVEWQVQKHGAAFAGVVLWNAGE